MYIIARASLFTYEEGRLTNATAMPWKPDEEESAYLSAVAERILQSDASRTTQLPEGSPDAEVLQQFVKTSFAEAVRPLISEWDNRLQEQNVHLDETDLAIFSFEMENAPCLCVACLQWKKAILHRDELNEDGQMISRLQKTGRIMPAPGGREASGMVINLSDGKIVLRDTKISLDGETMNLFSDVLIELKDTKSEKASVEAVHAALREFAPGPEMTPIIKREMDRSIEETGTIDVQEVADRIFRAEPEHETKVTQVMEKIQEEQVEPVIPVENKRVRASLQKLKIRTDTGISITLPRELAEDAGAFAVVNNEDGSISIVMGRISEIRTE